MSPATIRISTAPCALLLASFSLAMAGSWLSYGVRTMPPLPDVGNELRCSCPSLRVCGCNVKPAGGVMPVIGTDAYTKFMAKASEVVREGRAEMLTNRFITALGGGRGRAELLEIFAPEMHARTQRHNSLSHLLSAASHNSLSMGL